MKRLLSFVSALSASAAIMSLVLATALTAHGAFYAVQGDEPLGGGTTTCQSLECGEPDTVNKSCGYDECQASGVCGCIYDAACPEPDGDVGICCYCAG
jgi:hypothetical protein